MQQSAILDWQTWEILQAMFAEKGIYIESYPFDHNCQEWGYFASANIDDRGGCSCGKLRESNTDARVKALQEASEFLEITGCGEVVRCEELEV